MIRKLECNAILQGIDMDFSRRLDDSLDQNFDNVILFLLCNFLNLS